MRPVFLLIYVGLLWTVAAEGDPALVGTWVTKSRDVVTGPGFYDPVKDELKEPSNTGISYSFTEDGYYEEAYYRAVANPTEPSCPKGVMQFQHGKYSKESDGSLVLAPFGMDGRQLISDPCKSNKAIYLRYNMSETFERYEVQIDAFHKERRLNLYRADGSPKNPMFLAHRTPKMLPTTALHATAAPTSNSRVKRGGSYNKIDPASGAVLSKKEQKSTLHLLWWFGFISISIGSVLILFF